MLAPTNNPSIFTKLMGSKLKGVEIASAQNIAVNERASAGKRLVETTGTAILTKFEFSKLHLMHLTLVGPVGIEPTTHGLKVRCSTD